VLQVEDSRVGGPAAGGGEGRALVIFRLP